MPEFLQFPENFSWGTATAAYQIEGGVREDGRSDSIWDVFSHTPGRVANGDTGDLADDHYHLWKEDVALMKRLGYKAYRFSIAWPRILPEGKGKINRPGIDFYNRLIDELQEAGIKPLATLYHWDIPAALPGAWVNRNNIGAFEEFTSLVTRAFGDRVKDWITINEPFCPSFLSYKHGHHAPGVRDPYQALAAAHHLLLAHGLAVNVVRSEVKDPRVGISLNQGPFYPATQSKEDLDEVRRGDGELIRWFNDPVYGRHYPADMLLDYVKEDVLSSTEPDFIHSGDMEVIAVPTDFLGLNYYTRSVIRTAKEHNEHSVRSNILEAADDTHTEIGWEIYPYGLYETICRAYFTYKPQEIIITENGASYSDGPGEDGRVRDERRIAYLKAHIHAVHRAIASGVPVTGYYVWSLLDNFEWSYGYSQRFGLVHVDYATQKRTPKDSAYWYGEVIRQNGLEV